MTGDDLVFLAKLVGGEVLNRLVVEEQVLCEALQPVCSVDQYHLFGTEYSKIGAASKLFLTVLFLPELFLLELI